jgi:hypothetical protein
MMKIQIPPGQSSIGAQFIAPEVWMTRVRYIELLISTFLLYSLTPQARGAAFLHVFFLFFNLTP